MFIKKYIFILLLFSIIILSNINNHEYDLGRNSDPRKIDDIHRDNPVGGANAESADSQ